MMSGKNAKIGYEEGVIVVNQNKKDSTIQDLSNSYVKSSKENDNRKDLEQAFFHSKLKKSQECCTLSSLVSNINKEEWPTQLQRQIAVTNAFMTATNISTANDKYSLFMKSLIKVGKKVDSVTIFTKNSLADVREDGKRMTQITDTLKSIMSYPFIPEIDNSPQKQNIIKNPHDSPKRKRRNNRAKMANVADRVKKDI